MAFAGWLLRRSANQAINDITVTDVNFDTVVEDSGGFTTVAAGVATVKIPPDGAGVYLLGCRLALDNKAKELEGYIKVTRGATVLNTWAEEVGDSTLTAVVNQKVVGPYVYRLLAGDSIKVSAFQTSGSGKNLVDNGTFLTEFWGVLIGP